MKDEHGNKLVQIQVVHRHGARAPSYGMKFPSICGSTAYNTFYNFIPNLPPDVEIHPRTKHFFNPDDKASCYSGQLSPIGAAQMFALGARLRARYLSLLPETFDPSLIVVRSTCINRTVESAVACLSGMYPARTPLEERRVVDIDIRNRSEETMLGYKRICNRLYDISKAAYSSFDIPDTFDALATDLLPAYVDFDPNSEKQRRNRNHLTIALRDIAIAMRANGCEPQPWESQVIPLAVSQIHQVYPRESWRLGLGRFVDELLRESESHATNAWRCKIYSGHDTTILPMMACFEDGAHRGIPHFATDVVFETWQPSNKDEQAKLRIKYTGHDVIIKGCEQYGSLCPLSVVRKAVDKHIPKHFEEECHGFRRPHPHARQHTARQEEATTF